MNRTEPNYFYFLIYPKETLAHRQHGLEEATLRSENLYFYPAYHNTLYKYYTINVRSVTFLFALFLPSDIVENLLFPYNLVA